MNMRFSAIIMVLVAVEIHKTVPQQSATSAWTPRVNIQVLYATSIRPHAYCLVMQL